MRTTIRLDDDLFERLKQQAQRENTSLTRLLNRVIRTGLSAPAPRRKRRVKHPVYDMGKPQVPLDKALALAAKLEDDEIVRKLLAGK